MNIIKPSVEILFEEECNVYKKIEQIGKVCYKSEDSITEDSHIKFIANLLKRGHESVIEHGVFVLRVTPILYNHIQKLHPKFLNMTSTVEKTTSRCIISGSARGFRNLYKDNPTKYLQVIIAFLKDKYPLLFDDMDTSVKMLDGNMVEKELNYLEVLALTEPERMHHKFVTVKFICDRGVSHEAVRHRVASMTQESTRYCNYTQGKFGSALTFIDPLFFAKGIKKWVWRLSCKIDELFYNILIKWLKCTPQEARTVLPNSIKTELVMTMNLMGWQNFIDLRDDKNAHPQMRELAQPLNFQLKIKKLLNPMAAFILDPKDLRK